MRFAWPDDLREKMTEPQSTSRNLGCSGKGDRREKRSKSAPERIWFLREADTSGGSLMGACGGGASWLAEARV